MLLSSVNFVAKPKSGKAKKAEKKQIIEEKPPEPTECEMCQKERSEQSAIFQFPNKQPNSSSSHSIKSSAGYGSTESLTSLPGDRVTIATGDDLCLSVNQFYYTIGLKEESRSDSTCVFRKRVLESKQVGSGLVETVVFALDCDQDFYLTTNTQKELELNFFTQPATLEGNDDRTFVVHHTSLGHALIQPLRYKNTYLHHIDQALSVQQLDLNWRCPEEYFFHFNAIPEPIRRTRTEKVRTCPHSKTCSPENTPVVTPTVQSKKDVTEISSSQNEPEQILLPTRKVCKNSHFMKQLFVGCFGGRSKLISQDS